jgi:Yip1 domain
MEAALAGSSFSLDDETKESVETFYNTEAGDEWDGYVTSQAGFSSQFETAVCEEQQGHVPVATDRLSFLKYTDLSRYTNLFSVTVDDVLGRVLRACIPYRGLLDPPPPPLEPVSPLSPEHRSESDLEADTEEFDENVEHLTVQRPLERQPTAQVTSVESQKPFNNKEDLYGPFWLSTTLILSIAVASNLSALVRSVTSQQDPVRGHLSTLSAIDFRNMVHAASWIYTYIIAASVGIAAAKRYISDSSVSTVVYTVCVYGYATAPLIPAVWICAVGDNALSWFALSVVAALSAWTIVRNLWPGTGLFPFGRNPGVGDPIDGAQSLGAPVGGALAGRPPQWWLKCATAFTHVLAGLLLKIRFF